MYNVNKSSIKNQDFISKLRPCVFLKPHRVGSTYWRRALENIYENKLTPGITFGKDFSFVHPGKASTLLELITERKYFDLSARHIGWNPNFFSAVMRPGFGYVTLFRDPLIRSISYFHAFVLKKDSQHKSWADWYLDCRDGRGGVINNVPLDNYYSWFLGFDLNQSPLQQTDHLSHFGFVGITERWIESTILLASYLGSSWWDLRPSKSMASGGVNARLPSNYANSIIVDPDIAKIFRSNNNSDYELYEHYSIVIKNKAVQIPPIIIKKFVINWRWTRFRSYLFNR
jgi:hypothetical protein